MVKLLKTYALNLIDSTNNHNKFYYIFVFNNHSVFTMFGRRGTSGIYKKHCFSSLSETRRFAQEKYREKVNKGYKVLTRSEEEIAQEHLKKYAYINFEVKDQIPEKTKKIGFDPESFSDPLLAQLINDLLSCDSFSRRRGKADILLNLSNEIKLLLGEDVALEIIADFYEKIISSPEN
jgi:predicted DNA-binding WGR domain protein